MGAVIIKQPFILQIVGYKNSGKTTLTAELIQYFRQKNWRVGAIKHDAHQTNIDTPGTDTWQFSQSEAEMVVFSMKEQATIFYNYPLTLSEHIQQMQHLDIILIEGYKQADYPKIALLRGHSEQALLTSLTHVIAVVTPDDDFNHHEHIFRFSQQHALCYFIEHYIKEVYHDF